MMRSTSDVIEAIYDLRESRNCPRTFDTYFIKFYCEEHLISTLFQDPDLPTLDEAVEADRVPQETVLQRLPNGESVH